MRNRRGLTLVELLVVIVIMIALFAIVAAVGPHFGERQRTNRGASQLQGWILIAKQRALRDYAPRGIRLIPPNGPAEAQYVTQLQYIEQPEPYQPVALLGSNPVPANLIIPSGSAFDNVLLQFPPGVTDATALPQALNALWPENATPLGNPPDVVLEFSGRYPGQPRRVLSFGLSAGSLQVKLDRPFESPAPNLTTDIVSTEYRFYRKAQPIAGESVLQLPRDIAIDISRSNPSSGGPQWYRMFPSNGNALPTSPKPFDIVFDQNGQVIRSSGQPMSNRICLWVRDVSNNLTGPGANNNPNATDPMQMPPGDNVLITIYTRSGLIASHPVDDTKDPSGASYLRLQPGPNWNPFFFTQDGKSSGM